MNLETKKDPRVESSSLEKVLFPAILLRQWSPLTIYVLSITLIGIVAFFDNATGIELRIYPLYMVPVSLVSWRSGLLMGTLTSIVALIAWAGSNLLAGLSLPTSIWVFNTIAHLIAFMVVVVLVDYLHKKMVTERMLARIDSLTGLLNSRTFYDIAQMELNRQRRYPRAMSLAFMDLDNFKEVNDRFGHMVGDKALAIVASTLKASTRSIDILSRVGGDEFSLLLPDTDLEGTQQILQRAHLAIGKKMAENVWPVSCSIGAIVFDMPPDDIEEIVSAADHLMYRVKSNGKNAVHVEKYDFLADKISHGEKIL